MKVYIQDREPLYTHLLACLEVEIYVFGISADKADMRERYTLFPQFRYKTCFCTESSWSLQACVGVSNNIASPIPTTVFITQSERNKRQEVSQNHAHLTDSMRKSSEKLHHFAAVSVTHLACI